MVLQCKSSASATLTHSAYSYPSIRINFQDSGTLYHPDITNHFSTLVRKKSTGIFSWSIREDLESRGYILTGTFTSGKSTSCGATKYYGRTGVFALDKNVQPVIGINDFYQVPIHQSRTPGTSIDYFDVIEISQETYQNHRNGFSNAVNPLNSRYGLRKVNSCSGSLPWWNPTLSLAPDPPTRDKGIPAFFIVDIYESGVKVAEAPVLGVSPDFTAFPSQTNWLQKSLGEPTTASIVFTKAINTEAIEILPNPQAPGHYTVWKVALDASGEETGRNIIYGFGNLPTEQAVTYTLVCGSETHCPPGTCQVDCGSVFCCYGSDGIAVSSFNK